MYDICKMEGRNSSILRNTFYPYPLAQPHNMLLLFLKIAKHALQTFLEGVLSPSPSPVGSR